MLLSSSCEECRILVTRALEPFKFDSLVDSAKEQARNGSLDEAFGQPILMDFRSVRLVDCSSDDFRRDVRRRVELAKEFSDVPCALVAGSDADFGMLRMYATYAEIGGAHSTDSIFVTCSIDEAIAWLQSKLEKPNGQISSEFRSSRSGTSSSVAFDFPS